MQNTILNIVYHSQIVISSMAVISLLALILKNTNTLTTSRTIIETR